jgi:hypothetical protein
LTRIHDPCGTAAARLTVAVCCVPEIASITGHSLTQVTAILDAHYLSRDSNPGLSATQKLEAHEKGPQSPTAERRPGICCLTVWKYW